MIRQHLRQWHEKVILATTLAIMLATLAHAQLPNTQPLTSQDDLAMKMVAGISIDLDERTAKAAADRVAAHSNYLKLNGAEKKAATTLRLQELAKILGTTDTRVAPAGFALITTPQQAGPLATMNGIKAYSVRFEALPGVHGEGILLEPAAPAKASIVLLPDSAHSPEQLAGLSPGLQPEARMALALALRGCRVVCLTLLNRENQFSSNPDIQRFTNLPHREFLYRGSFEMGRTPQGYEIVKTLAAIDNLVAHYPKAPIAVAGHGEGGRIALYAGALDSRIAATWVSGAFGPRENLWQEPIDRNLWGIHLKHGDTQIADYIGDRGLVIETSQVPTWSGPTPGPRGNQAAPGAISQIDTKATFTEYASTGRAQTPEGANDLVNSPDGTPGSANAINRLAHHLKIAFTPSQQGSWKIEGTLPDAGTRQKRQLTELIGHTHRLWRASYRVRDAEWAGVTRSTAESWKAFTAEKRRFMSTEVIGELPAPTVPPSPKSRAWKNGKNWKGHEVTLDLGPNEFAHGLLLVPDDIKPGERRPVVVCQHGLEGRPSDVCDPDKITPYYNSFGAALASRGYIVFAPQNAYIGKDAFRVLQRKANPIKLSLFSYITRQHNTILDWLGTLPMVDANRIGFYGLSYGGKTAMRVPALLPRYALSICSGDFNEWVGKNILTDYPGSYVFTFEHEMPEFDLGHTFNYAEMAYLIAPRPFMVERGHDDGVGIDEMVAWEYARVQRQYSRLKISNQTEITYFSGGHEVRGGPCYEFLDRHLKFKPREGAAR